ncbi:15999_t:CDS:2, partial [Rhizophagus irregularis]
LENDDGLIENHLDDFKNNLISIYPNFEYLQKYSELYYNDFIKINLSIYSTKLDFILRHLIGTEDKIVNPFILHIYWWKYAAEILIQLKLVETFPDLITKAQNDFIVYAQAQDDNFINYEWNDKILKYNQRNMGIKGNVNFIFDLQKIEMKLARKLVIDKVYFKMENNQFYLKNFSFKYELFHNSPKILFDIKKVLQQVPIPGDKILMILTFFQQSNSSIILNSSTNLVNLSDLLFLFEIMLCFIKELSIQNNNMLILDFVDQWLKLARYNIASIDILKEFSLKHIIAYYVLIEEQVANSIIHNIDDKFKIQLVQQMKDSINKAVSYNSQNQQLIPARALVLALKRFIYRFLLVNSNIENQNLNTYILDFTLDLWTDDIKQELIKKLFPTCLLVSHAYNAYTFIVNEIEGEGNNESFASAYSLTARKNLIKKFKKFTS